MFTASIAATIFLLFVSCVYGITTTTRNTDVGSLPARWIPGGQLGVIHVSVNTNNNHTATEPNTTTAYNISLTSYMSTSMNRWSTAQGLFTPTTGSIHILHMMQYPYKHKDEKNASGGHVWFETCFSGEYVSASEDRPLIRWHGACGETNSTVADLAQSLSATVVWHAYGSGMLCREDHPMRETRLEDPFTVPTQKPSSAKELHHHREESSEDTAETAKRTPQNTQEDALSVKKVHLITTQHFDLGYTDFAMCVLDNYFWYIYPGAALTALEVPSYVYTTHPFILYFFFNCETLQPHLVPPPGVTFVCPSKEVVNLVTDAISRKQIVWHAFPFDGFNEMLGAKLYDYAFNYAKWLTAKFFGPDAQSPTVVQQVDVPGMYRVQANRLRNNGVRAVYVGQNPQPIWAGALSNMPNMFAWHPLGEGQLQQPLLMLVHKFGYGGIDLEDAIIDKKTGTALVCMITIENRQSETPQNVLSYLQRLKETFPNADTIAPSTFDAFVDDVMASGWPRSDIPSFAIDIGDSWLRSSAGDPVKNKQFLNYRRNVEKLLDASSRVPFPSAQNDTALLSAALLVISGPEHNAGLPMAPQNWEAVVKSGEEKRSLIASAASIVPAIGADPKKMKRAHHSKSNRRVTSVRVGQEAICTQDQGKWKVQVQFGADGSITSLARTEYMGREMIKTTVASPKTNTSLLRLLYTVHKTESPTWGDPHPDGVLLAANLENITIEHHGDDCHFVVRGVINQTFFDPTIGFWRTAKNKHINDDATFNGSMQVMLNVDILPTPNLNLSSSSFTVNASLSLGNIELSDANGVYHSYYPGPTFGNAFFVQFNPMLAVKTTYSRRRQSSFDKPALTYTPPTPHQWSMEALGLVYPVDNFRVNGTCHLHIADTAIYSPAYSSPTHHRSRSAESTNKVEIRSLDAQLMIFGWNNGRWQSAQDPDRPDMCKPDVSSGIWVNLWNQWNGNWVVGFPWKREDGLTRPLEFDFSVSVIVT